MTTLKLSPARRAVLWVACALGVLLVTAWVWNGAHPVIWSSDAWRLRVVDKDTGEPLEDATLVVTWRATEGESNFAKTLKITEVSSDSQGWFTIPAWGPIFQWRGAIASYGPLIQVLKDGYVPEAFFANRGSAWPWAASSVATALDGTTVTLTNRSAVSEQVYWMAVYAQAIAFQRFTIPWECLWNRVPRTRSFLVRADAEYNAIPEDSRARTRLFTIINKTCPDEVARYRNHDQLAGILPPSRRKRRI